MTPRHRSPHLKIIIIVFTIIAIVSTYLAIRFTVDGLEQGDARILVAATCQYLSSILFAYMVFCEFTSRPLPNIRFSTSLFVTLVGFALVLALPPAPALTVGSGGHIGAQK